MLKSLQLGVQKKGKLLIFDMDETLIAAKFAGSVPLNFESTFNFKHKGSDVFVRLRPYLLDILDKLIDFYEIVVFTASEKAKRLNFTFTIKDVYVIGSGLNCLNRATH